MGSHAGSHTQKEHKSESQQMEGGDRWWEREGVKTRSLPPGVPPKMQMRKVIKTGCPRVWNTISKHLLLAPYKEEINCLDQ